MISNVIIKGLLIEELENKKAYEAHYDLYCDAGSCSIEKGDEFFFVGSQKICNDCLNEIIEFVKNT